MAVDLICGNDNTDEPLQSIIFKLWKTTVFLTADVWASYVDQLLQCPHPLAGKTLRAGSLGPNPYIFTDYERNIHYNENGKPLGTNTGVAETLAKVFDFKTTIVLMKTNDYIDPKTKKWMGITGEVKSAIPLKITEVAS